MAKKGYLTAETTTTNGGDNIKKENGDGVSDGLGWRRRSKEGDFERRKVFHSFLSCNIDEVFIYGF